MTKISLSEFAPIISSKEAGNKIKLLIENALSSDDCVEIDFSGIKSMATFCAKQVFGDLYISMGSKAFFDKIIFSNASDNVQLIIRMGIQNAITKMG